MALDTLTPDRAALSPGDGSRVEQVFRGGGEMGERMRALDWSATALGPVQDWPPSLRTSLSICLGAQVPIALYWGAELVMLYNDAYRELLGERHPAALAAHGRDVWSGADSVLERVWSGETATTEWPEAPPNERHTAPAAGRWSLSHSPIHDESGAIAGVYGAASARWAPSPREPLPAAGADFSAGFLGLLAHDLRNPLSAIATAAQLLQLRADTPRIATPVDRILASADRLECMIVQLLDVARLHWGGGLGLARSSVDLAELAEGIASELGANPSSSICISSQGDLGGQWDRERLNQLLLTLTLNAVRHGTTSEPVTLTLDGSASGVVHFEIQNHGVMPAELQALVFDPLHQVQRAVRRDGASGLGLGLYLARQIALAHGGSLRLDSDAENGTRFRVTLPRALPLASREAGASHPEAIRQP